MTPSQKLNYDLINDRGFNYHTLRGWDGYLKETVSPQSTYTWYVHLVYLNGEEIEKIGVVHLMR